MFQSTIIIDPKAEIKGKQGINTHILTPTLESGKTELIRLKDVHHLSWWASQSSYSGEMRVAIVERLHQSSPSVQHALLKLVEEPPNQLRLVLTVNQIDSVLPTMASRCVVVQSSKLTPGHLAELCLHQKAIQKTGQYTSWEDFISMSDSEKLHWVVSIIKSKKDIVAQLDHWRSEVANQIETSDTHRTVAIVHLHTLEEASHSLTRRVLPRLVLHNLLIQLNRQARHI